MRVYFLHISHFILCSSVVHFVQKKILNKLENSIYIRKKRVLFTCQLGKKKIEMSLDSLNGLVPFYECHSNLMNLANKIYATKHPNKTSWHFVYSICQKK